MKRILLSAGAGLALAFTPIAAAAQSEEPSSEELVAMGNMFAETFTTEPLTEEQQARVPAAQAIIDLMMPEGFYAEMMGETMTSALEPMMTMISGPNGAQLTIVGRLSSESEALGELNDEEKLELATLLDPGFAERGPMMQRMMADVMREVAIAIEPGFRAGMANAYAVRFDAQQLSDIAAFFETPTGAVFARENIMLMTDPQVMSASMQAMPAMMEQFGNLGAELEAAMAELPAERGIDEMSAEERERMADLLGTDVEFLAQIINPPSDSTQGQ